MLSQSILRARLGTRAPFSAWSQPSLAQLHAAAPLAPRLARIPQRQPSQIPSRWLSSLPARHSSLSLRAAPVNSPASTFFSPNLPATRRPFFSGPRFEYQYNRYNRYSQYNQYNRFGGARRQPVFYTLIQRSRPRHFVVIGLGLSGLYLYNTDVVTETGRRRFICVTHQQELNFGEEGYREALNAARGKILPDYHPMSRMVDRVLQRLIPQAPIEGANWKVHVIKDDDNVNAFVLPGGKVFVYTGILPICQDEDGLATVLGHEIAHVVARHPAERMSNSFLTLGAVLAVSLLFDVSGQLSSLLINLMYSLPNSRTQEVEADNIGLMMMSKACFKPEAAVKLWARMQKKEKTAPPQFMSTHPSSYNREEAIRGWLAQAETIYENNGCSSLGQYVPGFHDAYKTQVSYKW